MEKTIGLEPSVETTLSELEKEQHNVKMELILAKLSNFLAKDLQEMKTDIAYVKTQIEYIKKHNAYIESITPMPYQLSYLKRDIIKWIISLFLGTMFINVVNTAVIVSYLTK